VSRFRLGKLKICFRFLGLRLKAIPAFAIPAVFMIFGLWFWVLGFGYLIYVVLVWVGLIGLGWEEASDMGHGSGLKNLKHCFRFHYIILFCFGYGFRF
jgi:hypothetical protein